MIILTFSMIITMTVMIMMWRMITITTILLITAIIITMYSYEIDKCPRPCIIICATVGKIGKLLQPHKYLIIIVNRITYSNNRITKNKSRMPLDLYIKLGPYNFSLKASVDHHGYSLNSGYYTASINCCGEIFHCNDDKSTECNITDTYNSSSANILLYKLIIECQGGNMSRRTFVVAGIVECLQPDRGESELILAYLDPWYRNM